MRILLVLTLLLASVYPLCVRASDPTVDLTIYDGWTAIWNNTLGDDEVHYTQNVLLGIDNLGGNYAVQLRLDNGVNSACGTWYDTGDKEVTVYDKVYDYSGSENTLYAGYELWVKEAMASDWTFQESLGTETIPFPEDDSVVVDNATTSCYYDEASGNFRITFKVTTSIEFQDVDGDFAALKAQVLNGGDLVQLGNTHTVSVNIEADYSGKHQFVIHHYGNSVTDFCDSGDWYKVKVLLYDDGNQLLDDDTSESIAPPLKADFDGSHKVDGTDFTIWQNNEPITDNTGYPELGDATYDGNVNGADFTKWQLEFNDTIDPIAEDFFGPPIKP